jgi:acid phosphatase class B
LSENNRVSASHIFGSEMDIDPIMTVGKPRLRWLEDAENYLRELEMWNKANNREDWTSVVKEAKIL